MNRVRALLQGLLAVCICLAAPAAHALCTVICTCSVSTTPIVFTPYNPLSSSNDDSTGNVQVSCGGVAGLAIPYSVALSSGNSGSFGGRQMSSGSKQLPYNLYVSNAYASVWGDGSGSTATVAGGFLLSALGLAPAQNLTVYGRIPGGQAAIAPGSYSDTLVVTLTYY